MWLIVIVQALLLFTVETLRFKSAAVVKANKLGTVCCFLHPSKTLALTDDLFKLVASFKPIRSDAIAIIHEISAELGKRAEVEATSESRKAFVDSCKSVTTLGVRTHGHSVTL